MLVDIPWLGSRTPRRRKVHEQDVSAATYHISSPLYAAKLYLLALLFAVVLCVKCTLERIALKSRKCIRPDPHFNTTLYANLFKTES